MTWKTKRRPMDSILLYTATYSHVTYTHISAFDSAIVNLCALYVQVEPIGPSQHTLHCTTPAVSNKGTEKRREERAHKQTAVKERETNQHIASPRRTSHHFTTERHRCFVSRRRLSRFFSSVFASFSSLSSSSIATSTSVLSSLASVLSALFLSPSPCHLHLLASFSSFLSSLPALPAVTAACSLSFAALSCALSSACLTGRKYGCTMASLHVGLF